MAEVLIVDDSKSMRQMVNFTLSRDSKYNVTEAEDGAQALTVATSQKFDLIITDMNMPVMNGIEFVRSLRAKPEYKFTPILMLTTESSPETKQKGREVGLTGWLVKPFNPEQLMKVIQKVLN
jgi:two-component system chemotaxis response regulator CheY